MKTQNSNQMMDSPVPGTSGENPARTGLEGARKALLVAATCTALACAGLPPLPPSGDTCPEAAVQNMKRFRISSFLLWPSEYAEARVLGASRIIQVRDGEFVWTLADPVSSKVPMGTKFFGELWVRDKAYGRVNMIETPEGQRYPVCMELVHEIDVPSTRYPGSLQLSYDPGASLKEPSREPGAGRIDIQVLTFVPVLNWGETRVDWHWRN